MRADSRNHSSSSTSLQSARPSLTPSRCVNAVVTRPPTSWVLCGPSHRQKKFGDSEVARRWEFQTFLGGIFILWELYSVSAQDTRGRGRESLECGQEIKAHTEVR